MKEYDDLPRAMRRRIRAKAATIGHALAIGSRHQQSDGRISFVTHPIALRALARGYAELVRNRFRPVVIELTATEGEALHPAGSTSPPPGARWWAAFGTDVDGLGTHSTCWTSIRGLPETEAREIAETYALECLARTCNVSGLPVEGVA